MNVDALITTRCGSCGTVELMVEQMWLVLTQPRERTHLAFRCPGCLEVSRRPVREQTLSMLMGLLPAEELHIPAEALETHTGAPLTMDDMIDLMVGLGDEAAAALATCSAVP